MISEPEAILALPFPSSYPGVSVGWSVVLWKSAHDGMLQTSALTTDKKCGSCAGCAALIGSVALFVLTGWYGLAALGCLFLQLPLLQMDEPQAVWRNHRRSGRLFCNNI